MQAPRMLPLLMSILAMPISLFMAILPGLSAMPIIMVLDLAMLSPVQAIIFADAGVSARTENMAAVIKIFFMRTSLKQNQPVAGTRGTDFNYRRFLGEEHSLC